MTAKCKKCGYVDDLSKFCQVLIIPGNGMDYACPKCDVMGIMNGNIIYVNEPNAKKVFGNALKKLRESFSKDGKI